MSNITVSDLIALLAKLPADMPIWNVDYIDYQIHSLRESHLCVYNDRLVVGVIEDEEVGYVQVVKFIEATK